MFHVNESGTLSVRIRHFSHGNTPIAADRLGFSWDDKKQKAAQC
jgi:hypothetical protein